MLELSYSLGGFPLNGVPLGLKDEEDHTQSFSSTPSSSSSSLSSPSSISSPVVIHTSSKGRILTRSVSHFDESKSYTERMDELLLSSSLRRENTLDGKGNDFVTKRTTSISGSRGAPFIVLPKEERFEILREKGRFAVDIGGTLVKLVYSSVGPPDGDGTTDLLLNFRKFQSIEYCIDFLKDVWQDRNSECYLNGTGGGSFKYAELLQKELGVKVKRTDEMLSLITGCDFLLRNNEDESFTYHHEAEGLERYQYKPIEEKAIYPFLLVNIGTGISVLKVDSPTSFSRVGGSTMGGGAFIGLGNLLTSARSFDELLLLAEKGDHRQVDSLVSDIYGGDYDHLGLAAEVIAGSFGKCSTLNHRRAQGLCEDAKEEDIAKSLLLMISNTIGQMAFLYSNRFEMRRIYFGGFFIRKHPISMRTLSYAINYWSKGVCEALFLKHEGYLGAVGSFLDMTEEQKKE
ncbi:pnk-1 [Pristionchus pacificus]|uniref:pantothenate kinase n=1 Tax=Pristionchus pacificus TaxID=54126 RepID=A0A2A6C4Z0_PRIPA|nr:pnk-1 [Pristionchus pacificus]|eukprot:PDM73199.1 pnk-1 [Pristionchus pacificus]